MNFDPYPTTNTILTNANATTLVGPGIVFDPQRDLAPPFRAPDSTWTRALESVAPTITEKIAEQSMNGESWTDTLQKILPALAMTVQQREILKIQTERARAGLPPLPNSEFGAQVSIGLDPQTRQILMIGGIALVGVLAFMAFRKR